MSVAAAALANPFQKSTGPFACRPAYLAGLARRSASRNSNLSFSRTVSRPDRQGIACVFATSAYDGDVQYANNVLPLDHKVRAKPCVHQVPVLVWHVFPAHDASEMANICVLDSSLSP